ncbi:toprim domain-containing protein [Pseudomonas aeruginosa]|nr:toprim domain-containing protein [Pseudomonas aeruginosa]
MDVPREERGGRGHTPRQPTDSPLYPLLSAAAEFYKQALKSHPARKAAVNYLKGRGLTGEIARDFGLGFAPPGWDNLLKHLGGDNLQLKAMLDAGLLVENSDTGKRYDRFRDRVMFPIRDSRGRIIAFGGRVLGDDKPKYLNSPETPVFHKGQELYGLYEARQKNRDLDEIMVVEGYMDVIALAQQGIRNAVATLGTATSEEHIKRLFRLVPSILFCFDGDQAGRKAAWRALESVLPNLQDGKRVRFLFLPEGRTRTAWYAPRARCLPRTHHPAGPAAGGVLLPATDAGGRPRHPGRQGPPGDPRRAAAGEDSGNNLRLLMRQRLSEITGLSGENIGQLAHHSPPPSSMDHGASGVLDGDDYFAASAYYENEPSHAPFDAAPGYGEAQPRKSWNKDKKPWDGKKWDGKKKWDKGGRGDFKAPQRTPVSVESTTLNALRTLLHHPQLALKVDDAGTLAREQDTYAQLLVSLLEALQKNPRQSSMQLIARWHGTPQGRLLQALGEKEWLIVQENLEKQFFDTITKLSESQRFGEREERLRSVMQKSYSELTDEEKALLREHYSVAASSPSQS